MKVDSYGYLSQGGGNNHVLAVPITLQAPVGLPDLVPLSLVAPASVFPGARIQVVYSVTNSGGSPAVGNWFDDLWFSTNAVVDSTATSVGGQFVMGPIPNRSSYVETNTVIIPVAAPGTYYLILQVDALQLTDEATRTNKELAQPIVVQPASLLPELAIVSLLAQSSATPGQSIRVTYAVTNEGGSAASGPWFDLLVLSTNTTAGGVVGPSGLLGFWPVTAPVAAGGSYGGTNTVVLPSVANGSYYLVLNVDFANSVNQSTRDYNVLAVPIALGTNTIPTPTAIILGQAAMLANGAFQFSFTNTPGLSFSVLTTTNLSLPLGGWTVPGNVTEISPGQFRFTDLQTTGRQTRFYRVRSP